ncbi:MAG: lipoprotein insertase outer membrane protein LolB [Betaproteobacteria bacterium]
MAYAFAALFSGARRCPRCGLCRAAHSPLGGLVGTAEPAGAKRTAESFTAAFELLGDARRGQLQLSTPLGLAVAQARWGPGEAVLRSGSDLRRFASAQDLLLAATGTEVPLSALFDWLEGRPTEVLGWQPDLSGLSQGRLQARRSEPGPAVELRIVLER